MRFKVFGLVSGLAVLIGSIVVPGSHSVNRDAGDGGTIRMQVADGMPLPPPPTPKQPTPRSSPTECHYRHPSRVEGLHSSLKMSQLGT
jgi:hypothetical protein